MELPETSFVVAVGNDGEAPSPYNRVQAPVDLVNGLGEGILLIMILLNESELATVVLVMEERMQGKA
ncbi:hypothetical protein P7H17_18395 [Paenibacillus larvae]|nr:hypothetical protein [Paenibacillus larvae]MDT2287634.1 hypothetical protein [Paenibacillus larvae]